MDSDDKMHIDELLTVSKGGSESDPPSKGGSELDPPSKKGPKSGLPSETNYQRSTIYINEPGLYTLIFTSKLESAKIFMKWITSEVLHLSEKRVHM